MLYHWATGTLRSWNIKVLELPSQSPDLNPIENLWTELRFELPNVSLETLLTWRGSAEEWDKIPANKGFATKS